MTKDFSTRRSDDVIDRVRGQLLSRLEELRPAVEEAQEIEQLLAVMGEAPTSAAARDLPGRRNLGKEARRRQILELLREAPGLRRKEIADVIQITAARVGQVVNELIAEGRLDEDDQRRLSVAEIRTLLDECQTD